MSAAVMVTEEESSVGDKWRLATFVAESFSRSVQYADQKAALLIAAIGVVLAGAGASQKQLWTTLHPAGGLSIAALVVLGTFAALLAGSAWSVGLVLIPRLFSTSPNPFYFGDATREDADVFVQRLLNHPKPERVLLAESHDLAKIALIKHASFRRAVYLYTAALAAFLTWLVLATMALGQNAALG